MKMLTLARSNPIFIIQTFYLSIYYIQNTLYILVVYDYPSHIYILVCVCIYSEQIIITACGGEEYWMSVHKYINILFSIYSFSIKKKNSRIVVYALYNNNHVFVVCADRIWCVDSFFFHFYFGHNFNIWKRNFSELPRAVMIWFYINFSTCQLAFIYIHSFLLYVLNKKTKMC